MFAAEAPSFASRCGTEGIFRGDAAGGRDHCGVRYGRTVRLHQGYAASSASLSRSYIPERNGSGERGSASVWWRRGSSMRISPAFKAPSASVRAGAGYQEQVGNASMDLLPRQSAPDGLPVGNHSRLKRLFPGSFRSHRRPGCRSNYPSVQVADWFRAGTGVVSGCGDGNRLKE